MRTAGVSVWNIAGDLDLVALNHVLAVHRFLQDICYLCVHAILSCKVYSIG